MSHPLAPAYIGAISPYQPGKPISELHRELGAAWPSSGAVKLASNENPFGASPRARAAMVEAANEVALYPDAASFELRARLAERLRVRPEQLIIGSGSNEIINLAVQTFVGEGEEVLTPEYQFICYHLAAAVMGRSLRQCENGPGFALSVDALLAAVRPATKLVFLANPNNPTGAHAPASEVARLVRELPADILLVLDEAYLEYADAKDHGDALPLLASRERMILLRTFSKIHGLAGLRVGYAVSHPPLVELMNRVRLPFNVSSIAQAAAIAALGDAAHVERSRSENASGRRRLAAGLAERGFEVFPSEGNFVLCKVPAPLTGPTMYDALLRRGVIVRPLLPYALPGHVRISVGTEVELGRLFTELDHVLRVGGPR